MVTRNGACPDTQNDIHSVSGYRDGCETCIKYSRSLQSGTIIVNHALLVHVADQNKCHMDFYFLIPIADSNDKAFRLGENQWVIWSVGPVGSLQTPADGIIPVPFKHYLRADYNGESDLHENSLGLPVSSATNPKPKACTPSQKNFTPIIHDTCRSPSSELQSQSTE